MAHLRRRIAFCTRHHLLKTFCNGWGDCQRPDGTLVWTSPTGHTYVTKPGGALYFPALAVRTGKLMLPNQTPPQDRRGLMMPTRQRTRAQERAARVSWERGINEARMAADPPPF